MAVVLLGALVTAACGSGAGDEEGGAEVSLLSGADRAAAEASADPGVAGEAITVFGNDLFSALPERTESDGQNVVVSPASVAIALAMLEPGAVDNGLEALHDLLRIDDRAMFHASMNALEQNLEARVPQPAHNEGEDPGDQGPRYTASVVAG